MQKDPSDKNSDVDLFTRPLFNEDTMKSIEHSDEQSLAIQARTQTRSANDTGVRMEHAEISPPTLNEWKRLYDAAAVFHDLAPWNWMFEDQRFSVVDSESGEVGYCSVLGSGGEFHALCVYRGEEGLLSYERIIHQNAIRHGQGSARDPDVGLGQKALMASFEGSKDVNKRDKKIFESLGLRFRGKQSWPVLRSYEPGCVPWFLNANECQFLTQALEQAALVVQRVRDDPKLLDEKPGCVFTRVHITDGKTGNWMDEWRAWPTLNDEMDDDFLQSSGQVSEVRLKRIMKPVGPSGAWEVDISYAPFSVYEGERPYFPRLMLCVHQGTGTILTAYPGEQRDADPADFVEQFVATMEQNEIYPSQIVVSRPGVARLLSLVAKGIGAEVLEVDFLPGVAAVRDGMREVMG